MPRRVRDLKGNRYGRLTVESFSHAGKDAVWHCICDCGNTVNVRRGNLVTGSTKSCGCLKIERIKSANTTHGHSVGGKMSRAYNIHRMMLQRCYDKNHIAYERYGGRGIVVCDRWHIFQNFLDDMGVPPEKHELDRIDNNGIYEKNNCRWVTRMIQGSNKRNNINITFEGVTLTMSQWARIRGISIDTLWHRLRAGWSTSKAISLPVRKRK